MSVYRDDARAALELASSLRDENDDLRRALAAVHARLAERQRLDDLVHTPRPRVGLVVVALLDAALVVGGALALMPFPRMRECPISTVRTSALELRRAAETWRSMHGDDCPTPEMLRRDRAIDAASKLEDPWDRPFVIQCEPDETYVHSAGSDRRLNTPDDILVPERPTMD